jgi:hypothetical protein
MMSCLGAVSRTLLVKLGQPLHTKIIDISSRLFFVTYAALPYSLVSLSAFCHLPRSVTIGLLNIVSRTSQPSAALPSPTFCVCIFLHSQVVQKMATTIPWSSAWQALTLAYPNLGAVRAPTCRDARHDRHIQGNRKWLEQKPYKPLRISCLVSPSITVSLHLDSPNLPRCRKPQHPSPSPSLPAAAHQNPTTPPQQPTGNLIPSAPANPPRKRAAAPANAPLASKSALPPKSAFVSLPSRQSWIKSMFTSRRSALRGSCI